MIEFLVILPLILSPVIILIDISIGYASQQMMDEAIVSITITPLYAILLIIVLLL